MPHRFVRTVATLAALAVLAGTVLATAVLAGCSGDSAAPPLDSKAARRLAVPPGKALVYLYRPTLFGAGFKSDVSVNDQPVGVSTVKSFFLIEAPPGRVYLEASGEDTARLLLNVEAGQRYFVHQEVSVGLLKPRTTLTQVSEVQGQEGVDICTLVRHVKL